MPTQAHSKAIWRESSGSGAVLDASPMFLVRSGADIDFSATGPEAFAFYDIDGSGDYTLLDLTPVFIVAAGADLDVNTVGPAAAVMADDGAGGIEITTDLSRTPIADLFFETGGDLVVVLRTRDRLEAALVGGNIQLY